jgi:hypothetical protein
MASETSVQTDIAYKPTDDTKHQVVVTEFLSNEVTTPACARELGAQRLLSVRPVSQYSVIDFHGARSLGNPAFNETLSFVR